MAYGITMTLDQLVTNAYLIATGKITPPASGTSKYSKLTALANLYTQDWSGDPDVDWNSLRSFFTVSPTVTTTDTYTIPATVNYVSRQEGDFVRITTANGLNEYDYTIVPPQRLYDSDFKLNSIGRGAGRADGTVSIQGSSIVFDHVFKTTSPEYGGTIVIPGYSIPATLANGSDVVSVDDPLWLVFRVAAEYIRNDITRVQLYGSLIDQANDKLSAMKAANLSQSETVYSGGWNPMPAGTGDDYPWQ